MKAKLLTLICFLVFSATAQSQVLMSLIFGDKLNSDKIEFGLEGGFNFSNIDGFEDSKRFSDFNLGFYFDISLKNNWRLYTGVLVKSKLGADELSLNDLARLQIEPQEEEGTYTQKLNYFLVPALLKYKFGNRIYLESGPQFGLRYKAFVEFNAEVDGEEIRVKTDNIDLTNPIEAGWVIGTGYHFSPGKGMSVGVKYFHGFTNVYKDQSGTNNSSIFVKMTVPIGAKKSEERRAKKEAERKKQEAEQESETEKNNPGL